MGFRLTIGKNPIRSATKAPLLPLPQRVFSNFPKPLLNPQRPTTIESTLSPFSTRCSVRSFLPTKRPVGKASSDTGFITNVKSSASMRASCGVNTYFLSALDKALESIGERKFFLQKLKQ